MNSCTAERLAAEHRAELDREATHSGLVALAHGARPSEASGRAAIPRRFLEAIAGRIERLGASLRLLARGHLVHPR